MTAEWDAARAAKGGAADAGWSLPEVLVVLLLALRLMQLGLDSLSKLEGGRGRIAARTDALVALRVSRHVLRRELRHGVAGTDWELDGDSLSLRAFRGVALVCASDSASATLVVSYAGDRAPDPAKDSVALLTEDGAAAVRAILATEPAAIACPGLGGGEAESWRLDRGAPPGTLAAKLFERGSYHLSDGALRYRRGASGRQPLTPEVWSAATGWTSSRGGIGLVLVPRDSAAGPSWSGLVSSWGGS
jgi:hypothetical protein